jgi:FkbM family methyltransferase
MILSFVIYIEIMVKSQSFVYNNNNYYFEYDELDVSEVECIHEIVDRNEYRLDLFTSLVGQHIVDIGANCGVATIILAKQNPQSTVYSFEPDPKLFNILSNNIKLNNLDNVKAFNQAVSDNETQKLTLLTHPDYSGGNTTYSDLNFFKTHFNNSHNVHEIEVECTSIDRLVNEYSMDSVSVLKIDCEGAEYDILYKSESFKKGSIKNLVGEFHNLRWNSHITSKAEDLIKYCEPLVSGFFKVSVLTY